MTDNQHAPLKWTSQLRVTPRDRSPANLQGDKILLPPSALEQLLSAATVTVVSEDPGYDPSSLFNTVSYGRQGGASRVVDRHQNLPYPLTFRLVNPASGNIVYAGIREFTAEEEEIAVSGLIRQILGLEGIEDGKITVHVEELPRGTYARLRPLEAGYDADWKPLLERHLRNTFTTLTKGEILSIPSGTVEYRFLVDKFVPDNSAVCIIDTDLEVDIEALNEEQARETLKKRLESTGKTSEGGDLDAGQEITGVIAQGDYIDYTLKKWDKGTPLRVELTSDEDVDIYISPLSPRQRNPPRNDEHVFASVNGSPRVVELPPTNAELDGAEQLLISAHLWKSENVASSASFAIAVRNNDSYSSHGIHTEPAAPSADDAQCKNCLSWVPKRTMVLHENFCFRNNVLCPQCKSVFQKSSPAWKEHWHCPNDESYGDSPGSRQKHDAIFHSPATCMACGYQTKNMLQLAQHRTSTCPGKIILCQFCHLLVPQQGPDDLDPNEPEVILSGMTPHELSDGSRTTECHMCSKIVRLRDMDVHLRTHNLERLTRTVPRLCRNVNCGRTLDGVRPRGEIKRQRQDNDIGLCSVCFGPLYNSAYDPDNRALRRRVERRYLTQFLTGCGNDFCRNEYCKTARAYMGLSQTTSKEAMQMVKPDLDGISTSLPLRFCTDEPSQKRRLLADMLAAEEGDSGYDLPWTVAALEAESGDLGKARNWLEHWAPHRSETR